MTSRYYLSPSRLYSVVRLSRDRQYYDVPLDSDWITIAIVCGKSEIRNINGGAANTQATTSSRNESDVGDDTDEDEPSPARKKNKSRVKTEEGLVDARKKTRKFVNLRLCSLPNKASRKGNGASGDTLLTLLLFEAESESRSKNGDSTTRHYRGGSGGAYEKWWKLDVGSVIGIVAPKVLKPWSVSASACFLPRRASNVLNHDPSSERQPDPASVYPSSGIDTFIRGRHLPHRAITGPGSVQVD
jgi:minichromosome maintenance protein 10